MNASVSRIATRQEPYRSVVGSSKTVGPDLAATLKEP